MAGLSKAAVKKLIKGRSNIAISDEAAAAIAEMLEKKAASIARYAVKRAERKKRKIILDEDIDEYRMKFGG
ncbi:MAG: histone-like protein [Candidatus Micrarchaeia archaeon]